MLIDERKIASLICKATREQWVDVAIPIDQELTKGKSSVKVKIRVAKGNLVGAYGFATVRR